MGKSKSPGLNHHCPGLNQDNFLPPQLPHPSPAQHATLELCVWLTFTTHHTDARLAGAHIGITVSTPASACAALLVCASDMQVLAQSATEKYWAK